MIFKRRRDRGKFIPIEGGIVEGNSELYDILRAEVDKIVTAFEDAKADQKVTLSEIWGLVGNVISSLVTVAETFSTVGTDKKAVVMSVLDLFYDEVIAPIDIKYVPNVIEGPLDRFAKNVFLEIVSGIIDSVVGLLNREGVFGHNGT